MAEGKSIVSWLPITLNDLRRHTLASMLFLCLIVISILYKKSENENSNQRGNDAAEIQELKKEVKQLRTEISFMSEQMRRSDSALADVKATLKVFKDLGKLQ